MDLYIATIKVQAHRSRYSLAIGSAGIRGFITVQSLSGGTLISAVGCLSFLYVLGAGVRSALTLLAIVFFVAAMIYGGGATSGP